jgi:hypothetical protein
VDVGSGRGVGLGVGVGAGVGAGVIVTAGPEASVLGLASATWNTTGHVPAGSFVVRTNVTPFQSVVPGGADIARHWPATCTLMLPGALTPEYTTENVIGVAVVPLVGLAAGSLNFKGLAAAGSTAAATSRAAATKARTRVPPKTPMVAAMTRCVNRATEAFASLLPAPQPWRG